MTPEAVLLRVLVLLPFPCFAGAFVGAGRVVRVTQLAFVAGVDLVQRPDLRAWCPDCRPWHSEQVVRTYIEHFRRRLTAPYAGGRATSVTRAIH